MVADAPGDRQRRPPEARASLSPQNPVQLGEMPPWVFPDSARNPVLITLDSPSVHRSPQPELPETSGTFP